MAAGSDGELDPVPPLEQDPGPPRPLKRESPGPSLQQEADSPRPLKRQKARGLTIEALPDEILRLIFQEVSDSTKLSVVLTCRGWGKLIPKEERPTPQDAFLDAAREGHEFLMKLYRERGAKNSGLALVHAAQGGQVGTMKLLEEWRVSENLEVPDFEWSLMYAAKEGQVEAMELLIEWGATEFNDALGEAARGGHLKAMDLMIRSGATALDSAMAAAAGHGHLKAMKSLKEQGGTGSDTGMVGAVIGGQPEAMKLLKGWGATVTERLLFFGEGNTEVVGLLEEWLKER